GVQILINESGESVACGYVQPIIDRTAYAAPVRDKAAESHIGCALYVDRKRDAEGRRYIFDAGMGACSIPVLGSHSVIGCRMHFELRLAAHPFKARSR